MQRKRVCARLCLCFLKAISTASYGIRREVLVFCLVSCLSVSGKVRHFLCQAAGLNRRAQRKVFIGLWEAFVLC